jgi:hypothetical protein
MKNKNLTFLIVLLIVVSAVPSLAGFFSSNTDLIYSGVVFNPIDGYTYLSKMQIGYSGDWLFTLPFTPEPGEGRFLYPFYIAAGQIMRVVPLPGSIWFNILRLLSYGFLVITLCKLVKKVFPENGKTQTIAAVILCAGGGLGWLLLPFGKFGADFWVSEAFPFLSGLANPHFPLSLGLMVAALNLLSSSAKPAGLFLVGITGIALSILSPFGFVVSAGVIFLSWLWERVERKISPIFPVLVFVVSGLPYCAYQYWAVQSTPQLAAWTAQNQTPSPAIWDLLLAFSPWLILLIVGWKYLSGRRDDPIIRKLIVWVIVGLVLTVVPFNLQRRFLFGLYIPIACLGLLALPYVAEKIRISAGRLTSTCLILSLLTPAFLLTMTTFAPIGHNPLYFYRSDELAAINWLSAQGGEPITVLASDQTGTLIPSVSRLRVLYGHPFESINAEKNKLAIARFFSGKMSSEESKLFLKENKINWILMGPREKLMGSSVLLSGKAPDKQFGEVSLYSVDRILEHE